MVVRMLLYLLLIVWHHNVIIVVVVVDVGGVDATLSATIIGLQKSIRSLANMQDDY
jgi:hypothetical protein